MVVGWTWEVWRQRLQGLSDMHLCVYGIGVAGVGSIWGRYTGTVPLPQCMLLAHGIFRVEFGLNQLRGYCGFW